MLPETISIFECLISNHKIYKGFQIQRERFLDPLTLDHEILEEKMEMFFMCALHSISWMVNPRGSSSLSSSPSISSTFFAIYSSCSCKSGWWCGSYCTTWSNGGVGWCWRNLFFLWLNENTNAMHFPVFEMKYA